MFFAPVAPEKTLANTYFLTFPRRGRLARIRPPTLAIVCPLTGIAVSQSMLNPNHPDSTATMGMPATRWYLLAGVLVVFGLAAMTIDCRLAAWCIHTGLPGDLEKILEIAEGFGHGFGVLVVLVGAYLLDPSRRWALARLATTAFGAGVVANIVKMFVSRTRPWAYDFNAGLFGTFNGFSTWGFDDNAYRSFPSGHTATIVGLAFGLTWLYPRGRWLFTTMAVLVACQRIEGKAHYLSDTLFAAALGCLVAVACLQSGPVCRWFDRKEAHWARKKQPSMTAAHTWE